MILVNGCECGAVLAHDQRYCVECGRTAAPFRPAGAARPDALPAAAGSRLGIPVPPQLATMVAAATLGFGLAIGTALDPNLPFLASAGAPAAAVEEIAAAPVSPLPDADGSGGGSGRSDHGSSSSPAPATTTVAPAVPPPAVPPEEPPDDEEPPSGPPPNDDGGVELAGVVIGSNPLAESYTVASGGALTSIHSEDPPENLPEVGAEVELEIDPLFNGTYEEATEPEQEGTAEEATFSGVVTHLEEMSRTYVVSSGGASRLVALPADSQEELPPLSASITVDAALTPLDQAPAVPAEEEAALGDERCPAERPSPLEPLEQEVLLEQQSLQIDFESFASASAGGILQAACADQGLLRISADDVRASGADLVVAVEEGIDLSLYEAGEPVSIVLDTSVVEDGGDPLIRGIAGDLGIDGADDPGLGQGEKAEQARRQARARALRSEASSRSAPRFTTGR